MRNITRRLQGASYIDPGKLSVLRCFALLWCFALVLWCFPLGLSNDISIATSGQHAGQVPLAQEALLISMFSLPIAWAVAREDVTVQPCFLYQTLRYRICVFDKIYLYIYIIFIFRFPCTNWKTKNGAKYNKTHFNELKMVFSPNNN